ncbi:MAG: prolipoprotein diacylglyceryl transferase [Anaerolineae bacterium]|nr:prolipoprotein diacylglyceryl transferase [Anaerolineae bacterium]
MYPELARIGSITLCSYTALIGLGAVIGIGLLAWRGHRLQRRAVAWLDVGIAGAAGGLIGGRLLHAALNWNYFRANPAEILQFWTGGYEWHGALAGALLAGYVAAHVRRVPPGLLAAAAAPALPIFTALAWGGCLLSNCGYGQEVRSLADFPAPLVAELPDRYYTVAPRFNTQLFGMVWSMITLAAALWLVRGDAALDAKSFWRVLAIYSLGHLLIAFLRADPMPAIGPLRLDQGFDVVVMVFCAAAMLSASRNQME